MWKIPNFHLKTQVNAWNKNQWYTAKAQKKRIEPYGHFFKQCKLPCKVTLIRISPRECDEDNLAHCFKYIRDFVASCLIPGLPAGHADKDKRIQFEYIQKKGDVKEKSIIIQIEEI